MPRDVRTWTEKIKKDDIAPIEDAVLQLETVLENVKQDELRRKEGLAAQATEEKAQEQLKYDKEKFELQFIYEKKLNEEREKLKPIEQGSQKPNVRLQKLQITKFDGTHTDWLRFWNQFEAEIYAVRFPIGRTEGENFNSGVTVRRDTKGLGTSSRQGMENLVK